MKSNGKPSAFAAREFLKALENSASLFYRFNNIEAEMNKKFNQYDMESVVETILDFSPFEQSALPENRALGLERTDVTVTETILASMDNPVSAQRAEKSSPGQQTNPMSLKPNGRDKSDPLRHSFNPRLDKRNWQAEKANPAKQTVKTGPLDNIAPTKINKPPFERRFVETDQAYSSKSKNKPTQLQQLTQLIENKPSNDGVGVNNDLQKTKSQIESMFDEITVNPNTQVNKRGKLAQNLADNAQPKKREVTDVLSQQKKVAAASKAMESASSGLDKLEDLTKQIFNSQLSKDRATLAKDKKSQPKIPQSNAIEHVNRGQSPVTPESKLSADKNSSLQNLATRHESSGDTTEWDAREKGSTHLNQFSSDYVAGLNPLARGRAQNLTPEQIAEWVNEILVEEARRNGVDIL